MLKTKKILISILILVLILIQFSTICLAASTPVTDENLKEALQKFTSSEANEDNYNITVSNNDIILSANNETYTLKYDLSGKPTFSFEIPIEKGMSYDEFKKQTDNMMLPMVGYIAVANIQGVSFEDASAYFLFSYLGSALNGSFSFDSSSSYMIIDDTNTSDGVTIETTNPNAIYVSQFGERVMEYVNAVYPESQSISDSEGINSYTLSVERKDTTETSCKLVSTLSVNLDADFSTIIGYTQQMADSFLDSSITKENADLVVDLKVGQKCKIESSEEITGYQFSGYDCIELSEDKTEITATSVGTKNGYLYVGEGKKSIYITVEENTGNSTLETITLKIDSTPVENPSNTNPEEEKKEEVKEEIKEDVKQENNNTSQKDNTVVSSKLPQAGSNSSILFIIMAFVILIILIGIRLRKYNDIG